MIVHILGQIMTHTMMPLTMPIMLPPLAKGARATTQVASPKLTLLQLPIVRTPWPRAPPDDRKAFPTKRPLRLRLRLAEDGEWGCASPTTS